MSRSPRRTVRRTGDRWVALGAGLGYAALAGFAARDPRPWEKRSFLTVNRTGGTMRSLRVPQQMGTPWVLPGTAAVAFWTHRPHLAVAAALALPLEKGLEVGVKKVVQRRRPAKTVPDTTLRDDAPTSGPSYPSGHAAIACALVVLTAPQVPAPVTAALAGVAVGTSVTRVHQGAHYPVDAVGGAFLGVAVGSLLHYAVGRDRS